MCACSGRGKTALNKICDGKEATSAVLKTPSAMFLFNSDLYIADTNNHRIRKVNGTFLNITTVVGNPECTDNTTNPGYSGDGYAATSTNVKLYSPSGITLDDSGINFNIF